MNKNLLIASAILGALAVALGAFGAHALKQLLSDTGLKTFETAVRYQFYHVFALLTVCILYKEFGNHYLRWAGRLFLSGIFFFSGSLYLLTLMDIFQPGSFRWIGLFTPIGGACFIAGWIFMAVAVKSKKESSQV